MDEKEILAQLRRISTALGEVQESLKKNDWDSVEKLLARVNEIQTKIKENEVSVETFLSRDPLFEKEYSDIKEKLLEQVKQNNADIEAWKMKQTGKIAGSRNILDTIARYYTPPNTSYYIDKKE
jgi:DNA repair ATPase RecN